MPNDGVMEMLACLLIKSDGCLPLVGDADSLHIFMRQIQSLGYLFQALQHIGKYLLWIMFNPSWLAGYLLVLSCCYINNFQVMVEHKHSA